MPQVGRTEFDETIRRTQPARSPDRFCASTKVSTWEDSLVGQQRELISFQMQPNKADDIASHGGRIEKRPEEVPAGRCLRDRNVRLKRVGPR